MRKRTNQKIKVFSVELNESIFAFRNGHYGRIGQWIEPHPVKENTIQSIFPKAVDEPEPYTLLIAAKNRHEAIKYFLSGFFFLETLNETEEGKVWDCDLCFDLWKTKLSLFRYNFSGQRPEHARNKEHEKRTKFIGKKFRIKELKLSLPEAVLKYPQHFHKLGGKNDLTGQPLIQPAYYEQRSAS